MALFIPAAQLTGDMEAAVRKVMAATGARTTREYFKATLAISVTFVDKADQEELQLIKDKLRGVTGERPKEQLQELAS